MQNVSFYRQKLSDCFKRIGIVVTTFMLGMFQAYADVFDVADKATTTVTTGFFALAKKILPLSFIICGVTMIFTHDERALRMEFKILIGIAVGYVVCLLASNGTILNTLDQWFS